MEGQLFVVLVGVLPHNIMTKEAFGSERVGVADVDLLTLGALVYKSPDSDE